MNKPVCLLLTFCIALLLTFACGGGGGSGGGSSSISDSETETMETTGSDVTTIPIFSDDMASDNDEGNTDSCGNDVGNGLEIVDGPDGPIGEDFDSVFRALAVHPTDSDIILIGTERNGFVKSIDGGTSWTRLRAGLRHAPTANGEVYPEIWDIAFDPNNPSVVYAATLDSPGPVTGDHSSASAGVYKSTDGGESWSRSNCGLSNSRITSVKVHPANSEIVIIGVEGGYASTTDLQGQYFNGGIYRSIDAGANWTNALDLGNADKNGYWHIIPFGSTGNDFITFGMWSLQNASSNFERNVGFLKSMDSGASWEIFGNTLQSLLITGIGVSQDGQTIYANEQDSFEIQKSTDGGLTWNVTDKNQANGPIAVSPTDASLVLYAGTRDLYRSTDGLLSTEQVLSAERSIHDIVFAPSNSSIVYVATEGYLVYKSIDAGATFSLIKNIRADVLN